MMAPSLTKHAKQRIRERFNVKAGGEQSFVNKHFGNAELISELRGDDGDLREYYVVGNIVFVVAPKNQAIVTVESKLSKVTSKTRQSFKQRIQAFIKSEIDRIKSAGESQETVVVTLKTDIISELAERYAELKRARSLPKKLALKGRIAALEERLGEIPDELRNVRAEVRKQINGALAHY